MKKIIILLLPILFLLGCENTLNTPTSKVESFFKKYQTLDKNVLLDIDNYIDKNNKLTKKQKEEYKEVLKKQYQNLSYKIKNEEVEKDVSIVETEIEVLNYSNINEKDIYKKIEKMKNIEEKKKYEITFYLNKEKGVWVIEKLNDDDYLKINGLY